MKIFLNNEECCGCTACESICPKEAINMEADSEGFKYPQINDEKCVECGLCIKVCPLKNKKNNLDTYKTPKVYAVKHKDDEIRLKSRSGGVFSAISDWILDNNGAVYGVGYNKNFTVCHKRATTKSERDEFRGSKYVQSDLEEIFNQVKDDLKNDKYVLFSGTPCQVDGLINYLQNKKIMEKLFLVDIICHGVPSPLIWKEYIEFFEKKYKSSIKNINFRDKRYGWASHIESYRTNRNKVVVIKNYTNLFYKHVMIRPVCKICKYTNIQRISDITIGDFWGIDKAVNNFNDNRGVSLVLVNTKKAELMFNEINKDLVISESNIKNCLQHNLQRPTKMSDEREEFWNDYKERGFEYILNKYGNYTILNRIKSKIRSLLY